MYLCAVAFKHTCINRHWGFGSYIYLRTSLNFNRIPPMTLICFQFIERHMEFLMSYTSSTKDYSISCFVLGCSPYNCTSLYSNHRFSTNDLCTIIINTLLVLDWSASLCFNISVGETYFVSVFHFLFKILSWYFFWRILLSCFYIPPRLPLVVLWSNT